MSDESDLRWLVGHLLAHNPAGNTIGFPARLQSLLVACRDEYDPSRFTLVYSLRGVDDNEEEEA